MESTFNTKVKNMKDLDTLNVQKRVLKYNEILKGNIWEMRE